MCVCVILNLIRFLSHRFDDFVKRIPFHLEHVSSETNKNLRLHMLHFWSFIMDLCTQYNSNSTLIHHIYI
jgi:hypothetical protein